jgi:hypothetical protein
MNMVQKQNLVLEEKELKYPEMPQSYLMADVGHSNTRVTLYDLVEGNYRFVARGIAMSTIDSPWYDATFGLVQAIQQISKASGRALLDVHGHLIQPVGTNGAGIDYFGAVTSAGDPMKVLVAGLLTDVSIASMRRAMETAYAMEVDCFSLDDTRDRVAQVEALLYQRPELILLTGGTDGGANRRLMNLANTIAIALGILDETQRPMVVYAGNAVLQPQIKETLGKLTTLIMTENVRPDFDRETLGAAIGALADIYLDKVNSEIPGLGSIRDMSAMPLKTTAHSLAGITEYLAAAAQGRALCLDVGSSQMTIAIADQNRVDLLIQGNLGQGRPLGKLLTNGDLTEHLDWTFADTITQDIHDFINSRILRPSALPFTEDALRIEQSLLRQMLTQLKEDAAARWGWPGEQTPPVRLLLLRGGSLANSARPQPVLLAVLDAFQPTGIFRVAADGYGVLPAMGLLAAENPRLVVQVLEWAALEDWGWVVVASGRSRPGEIVLRVQFESRVLDAMEVEVAAGALEVLPLPAGESVAMTLTPADNIDIGFGLGVSKKVRIEGGSIGLVIDARGRPLPVPSDAETRRNLRQRWLRDIA